MSEQNPFADPNFGADQVAKDNPFADPEFGKPRGAASEIGTAALRGLYSGVRGAGAVLQAPAERAGAEPGIVSRAGKSMEEFGKAGEERNKAQTDQHGPVTNFASQAAESIGGALPVLAGGIVGGAAGSVLPGPGNVIGSAIGAGGAAAAQTWHEKYQEGLEKKLPDAEARSYADKSAALSGAAMGALGAIPGAGAAARAALPSAKTAAQAGAEAVGKKFLPEMGKQAAAIVGGNTALGVGQAAGQAEIDKSAGLEGPSAWEAAKAAAMPSLAGSVGFLPLGALHAHHTAAEAAKAKAALENPDAHPLARARAANAVYESMKKVDEEAADAWKMNALEAMKRKMPIGLDDSWTNPHESIFPEQKLLTGPKPTPAGEPQPAAPGEVPALPNWGGAAAMETPGMGGADASTNPFDLSRQHAAQSAQDHADAVYAARDAEEARQQSLREQQAQQIEQAGGGGTLSSAAAQAVRSGAADESMAQRTSASEQAATEAKKAPAGDVDRNVAIWARGQEPTSLADAQRRADLMEETTRAARWPREYGVVPHPDGNGYMVMPTEHAPAGHEGLRRPAELPPPPERSLPLDRAAADKKANELTRQYGVEHEVVPHPLARDKFAVQPKDTFTEREHSQFANSENSTANSKGVDDAVQEQGAAGLGAHPGGDEGAGRPGEGGGVGQGVEGQEAPAEGGAEGALGKSPAGRVQPGPIDANFHRLTADPIADISEEHGGSRAPTGEEAAHIHAALRHIESIGGDLSHLGDLSGIHVWEHPKNDWEAAYYPGSLGFVVSPEYLKRTMAEPDGVQSLAVTLSHEGYHYVDHTHDGRSAGVGEFHSSNDPRFEIIKSQYSKYRHPEGDVAVEAVEAFKSEDNPFREMLAYPLSSMHDDPKAHGVSEREFREGLQNEMFAQLGLIYDHYPEMMQEHLPVAYQLFKDIHDQSRKQRISLGDSYGKLATAARRGEGGVRADARGKEAGRDGVADQVPEPARSAPRPKREEVKSEELKGDGRTFTPFFTDATKGGRAPNTGRKYKPVLDIKHAKEFSREYEKHRGNFDDHIATSIPGFREIQQAVGHAISKVFDKGARVLDIGASEGSFIKAISAVSEGRIKTVGLDPNQAMAEHFAKHSTVEGSSYDMSAFGSKADEGKLAWTEDNGTPIHTYKPDGKFDVAHEAMTFQFISDARDAQVARIKELLNKGGVAMFEQKFTPSSKAEFDANEAKKDAYKAQYFSKDELERKKKDVLERGEEAHAADEKAKEEKVVGMHNLMVSPEAFEAVLKKYFDHVVQYWDSGNFKGYMASDDPVKLHQLSHYIGDVKSDYSTVETPRQVAGFMVAPGEHVVNIGLNTNDGKGITKQQALSELKKAGITVMKSAVHGSDTEPTLVAKLNRPLTPAEAHAVSVALRQEAIAQVSDRAGEVYGPAAHKWKPFNPDYFVTTEGKRLSEVGPSGDETVSTRNPTAVRRTENPLATPTHIGFEAMKRDAELLKHNVELMHSYPNFARKTAIKNPEQIAERMIRQMVDNLLWLHDQVPEHIKQRSKLWYVGAHKIANDWAKQYGVERRAAAGILAVLSPQKDWFMNVSLARRVLDVVTKHKDEPWSREMTNTATRILKTETESQRAMFQAIQGKKYSDLKSVAEKARWLRVYDEAHNARTYPVVHPEGHEGALAVNDNGKHSDAAWGSFPPIENAISIFENPSMENIHDRLGEEHKVRSFYNNIVDPNSKGGHVTIDTHAVAAALLRALSGKAREVLHNFGNNFKPLKDQPGEPGPSNSSVLGLSGTYGLFAEAYRRAAEARGILPREMQSITWEAVRGLFKPGFKSQKRNVAAIDEIWHNYARGKYDINQARELIREAAHGIEDPEWVRDAGLDGGARRSPEQGDLLESGVPGFGAGGGGGAAADVPPGRPLASKQAAFAPRDPARDKVERIGSVLTPDLLSPEWRAKAKAGEDATFGHCYAAAEAAYHLLGGKAAGWVPQVLSHATSPKLLAEGETHWFIRNERTGEVVDPTAAQFKGSVPYDQSRGNGFLTAQPSKRAAEIIDRVSRQSESELRQSSFEPGNVARRIKAAEVEQKFTKAGEPMPRRASAVGPITHEKDMPEWVRSLPPDARETLRKAGVWVQKQTLRERWNEYKSDAVLKVLQGTVDQFRPVLEKIGEYPYKLLRMASASSGALDQSLHSGHIEMNDWGALQIKKGTKGLLDTLKPLGNETDRFLAWVAGNRAERLMAEGREHNFTNEQIAYLKQLNGKLHADDAWKGEGSRAMTYASVLKDWNAYSKSILDIAERSGLIDGEARKQWEHDFYVPFYRQAENTGPEGGNISGMVNKQAFKKLKGGQEELKDLLANSLGNWAHLLDASLRNNAAWQTLDKARELGIAENIKEHEAAKGDVFVMRDGKKEYYRVNDKLVLDAVSSLSAVPFRGPVMKALSTFKNVLTHGVTMAPTFRVRNVIRDQISALAVNDISHNFVANIIDGFKYSAKDNPAYADMQAGGAFMHLAHNAEGGYAEHVKRLIAEGVDKATILDNPNKVSAMFKRAYEWWEDTGERSESLTRATLYRQAYAKALEKGMPPERAHFEAAYAARDSMDFGLRGTWPAVRMLTQVVPFMNARLQGLYKLGRGGIEDHKRFAAVVGGVTLATIALSLANRDDKEIQNLPDSDHDNNWIFRVGDTVYRIPKPFEIGALGTIIDRGLTLALDGFKPSERELFASRLWNVIGQQLNMNPIPQAFWPAIQLWANYDSFRGASIETQRDQKLTTSQRIGPNTSATAQLLGKAEIASPEQIDFLVNAYLGWVGAHAVATADLALRPAMGLPDKPARRVDDYFIVGDFVHQLPSNQSRFVEKFYQHLQDVQQAMGDLRTLQQTGQAQAAAEYAKQNKSTLALAPYYTRVQRQIGDLNRRARYVQMRTEASMTPDEKRRELDRIAQLKLRLTEAAEGFRAGMRDRPQ